MRRILGHALGATAIALLLVVLCVPALARTEVAPLAAPEAALPKPPEKSPGRTHQAGVRALPLTPPDGLVAREFPSGRGLDDSTGYGPPSRRFPQGSVCKPFCPGCSRCSPSSARKTTTPIPMRRTTR